MSAASSKLLGKNVVFACVRVAEKFVIVDVDGQRAAPGSGQSTTMNGARTGHGTAAGIAAAAARASGQTSHGAETVVVAGLRRDRN